MAIYPRQGQPTAATIVCRYSHLPSDAKGFGFTVVKVTTTESLLSTSTFSLVGLRLAWLQRTRLQPSIARVGLSAQVMTGITQAGTLKLRETDSISILANEGSDCPLVTISSIYSYKMLRLLLEEGFELRVLHSKMASSWVEGFHT